MCAFGVDENPQIEHASWGNCTVGGTLAVGQHCDFMCDEGFVSYSRTGELGRPRANCIGFGRSVEIVVEGQCTNPQCIDNGLVSRNSFPFSAFRRVSPMLISCFLCSGPLSSRQWLEL